MSEFPMNATVVDIAVAKKAASLAQSCVSAKEKVAKSVEIGDIVEGTQSALDYIAELTRELAALANGANLANLARLLAMAQLEAELWLRQGE